MILLHIRYFLNQEGIDRPAYSIAAKNIQNLSNIDMLYKQSRLAEIPGVGKRIAKMIEEIISTGRCEYYDKLRSCFDIPKYSLPSVIMYTDGACKGNPGPGGWAAIIISDNGRTKQELTGKEPVTTNNRMELIASIEGLKAIRQPSYVKIYSDSAYLVNAFNQHWVDKWQANNWQLSDKKSKVKNYELWQELIKLTQFHHVEWIKVKGHGEDEYNKQCDKLAVRAAESIS
jgi:ribonuclease HI